MDDLYFYRKTLQKFRETEDFEQLRKFCDPCVWEVLELEDRDSLAQIFVEWGDMLLQKGEKEALEIFKMSKEIAPWNNDVLFSLGILWLNYAKEPLNPKGLQEAEKNFEKLVELEPNNFKAWLSLGNTLMYLGVVHQQSKYFHSAIEKYRRAHSLSEEGKEKIQLFWDWGRCYYFLGKHSGEALDFFEAVKQFKKVKETDVPSPLFWNDYGNTMVEMACLINRVEMFEQGLVFYERCFQEQPDYFEACLNAACTAQRLFYLTTSVRYLHQAHIFFVRASAMNPKHLNLWLKWGGLILSVGKLNHSVLWIKESISKFSEADNCEKDHPLVLSLWGEALMLLGGIKKDLKLLRLAENKILRSLFVAPENPDTWFIYGSCLNEFGGYFEDSGYYQNAVSKFRYALTLDKKHPLLWYGLALSYFSLAEIHEDQLLLEKSLACFAESENCGESFCQLLSDWAIALMRMGEISNEREYVELAIEKFEKKIRFLEGGYSDLESFYHYGCAFDILGDFYEDERYYERAVRVLSYVLSRDSTYSYARYNLAVALSHLGESIGEVDYFHKAIEHFHVLIKEDCEDEMSWNEWGLALLNLAYLLDDHSSSESFERYCLEARNKLRHAAALGNVYSYYPLACVYSLMEHYDEAMSFIERAEDFDVLPTVKDILSDECLKGLRATDRFRYFISLRAKKTLEEEEH